MPLSVVDLVRGTIELSAFVGILLLGFLFSWKYLRVRCFVPLHIHSFPQKLTFSFTLVVSCFGLTTLLFADITGAMSASSRMLLWHATLLVLVLLLVVAFPAAQAYHFYTRSNASTAVWDRKKQVPLAFGTWAAAMLLHWWVLSPKKMPFQNELSVGVGMGVGNGNGSGNDSIWSYPGWIKRIGIVGVVLTAVLSGYGSVTYIYDMLFPEEHSGKKELLARFREQLADNERFINEKYDKLRRLKGAGNAAGSVGISSSDGDAFGLIEKLRSTTEYEDTLHDIEALESFGRRLRDEISRLQRAQEEERAGRRRRPMRDRVDEWVSWGVWLYCVYYVLASLYRFFFLGCSAGSGADVITASINLFLSLFRVSIDTQFWSQFCAALFSGGMVFVSLRSFFLNSSELAKRYDIHDDDDWGGYGGRESSPLLLLPPSAKGAGRGSLGKRSWSRFHTHVVLGMCQIMGAYFLSTLILTAGSLPPSSRETFTASLGGLDVRFYQEWSNALQGISIIGSILTILIKKRRT